jgi:MOSC domain-containing protein YiiM
VYTVEELKTRWPRPGRLEWIGLRPERRAEVISVPQATLRAGVGLLGDHGKSAASPLSTGKRQVTLLQAEHLPVIAALAGLETAAPELLRRNLLVSGLPLHSLKDRRFRVGGVLLEGSGECHPCSRMEEVLGPGGYNAVRGHGGLTAWVLEDGVLRVGDPVVPE